MTPDKWIYRMIVLLLGVTMLASVAAATVIVLSDRAIPDMLVMLAGSSVTGLVGVLVPSPLQRS